jgi:hypothetical protein
MSRRMRSTTPDSSDRKPFHAVAGHADVMTLCCDELGEHLECVLVVVNDEYLGHGAPRTSQRMYPAKMAPRALAGRLTL